MATEEQTQPYNTNSALPAFLRVNPIALKELRGRMRGARAFIVLTVYVGLMSIFAAILYMIYSASQSVTFSADGSAVGKLIFGGVVAIELFLVCFISPAFTAGAISGERERQTLNLLRTTLLPARRIVLGKLVSAMAYILLLLLAAVPLQSLAFLMGGVVIEEVFVSVWMLMVTALCFSAIGIYFSTVTQKTLSASVLTYAVALAVTVALPLATLVTTSVKSAISFSSQPATELVLSYIELIVASTNPITTAIFTELALLEHNTLFIYTETVSNGTQYPLISPWLIYSVLLLVATAVLITGAIRKLKQYQAS